jgi:hypothetical protein
MVVILRVKKFFKNLETTSKFWQQAVSMLNPQRLGANVKT